MGEIKKMCVFCGKLPKAKNKEHVLPYWLMDHVGVANQKFRFGFDKHTGLPREFVCKYLTFPACESCNTLFAELESQVKPIVLKLLSEQPLTNIDFHYLLDWFDKVRIGLWLGFYYLDGNIGGISPNFHIATRIGNHDRMLHIVKVKNDSKELSFRCCDTLSFHFTPSCFSMIINNFCFYNISAPFLFARRLGFPYPASSYMMSNGLADYGFEPARIRVMSPIFKNAFAFRGTGIYQPIYRSLLNSSSSELCNNEYVKSRSISFKDGVGSVFIALDNKISLYPSAPVLDWCPVGNVYDRSLMNPGISIDTLRQQLYVDSLMPSYKKMPKIEQARWKKTQRETRIYSKGLIKILEANAKRKMPETI